MMIFKILLGHENENNIIIINQTLSFAGSGLVEAIKYEMKHDSDKWNNQTDRNTANVSTITRLLGYLTENYIHSHCPVK